MREYTAEQIEQFSKAAYEAYGETTGNKNYQGLPMPTWEALPQAIRTAWHAATRRIAELATA